MTRLSVTFVAVAVAALVGCAEHSPPGMVAQEASPIIDGLESPASDDGVLYIERGTVSCSSVLIAPNALLTALHCVAQHDTSLGFTCSTPKGDLSASNPNGGKIGAPVDPATITVRSGALGQSVVAHAKKIVGTGTLNICRNDIAIVILDTSLDLPITPVRLERETKPGELGRAIGYGDIDGNRTMTGRHYRDDIPITAVGPKDGSSLAAPYWVVTGEGPCHGDSGGPLISEETGAVIGVYSINLSTTCKGVNVRNAYTEVSPFASLIRSTLKDAGSAPIEEPYDPPTGAGGQGNGGEGGVNGTGQAGDASASEGGSDPGAGGSAVTGGTGGSGAKGGSSASGATGGTSTTEAGGTSTTGAGGTTSLSSGSGSRRSGGCAVGSLGQANDAAPGILAALLAALAVAVRRRSAREELGR